MRQSKTTQENVQYVFVHKHCKLIHCRTQLSLQLYLQVSTNQANSSFNRRRSSVNIFFLFLQHILSQTYVLDFSYAVQCNDFGFDVNHHSVALLGYLVLSCQSIPEVSCVFKVFIQDCHVLSSNHLPISSESLSHPYSGKAPSQHDTSTTLLHCGSVIWTLIFHHSAFTFGLI